MYEYSYICIHIYKDIFNTYTHLYVCICMYVHVHACVCERVCMCEFTDV